MNAQVETILRLFPDLSVTDVRRLDHDGQYSDILLVGGRWVFRFPRHSDAAVGLGDELAILHEIAGRLPLLVPEPRYANTDPVAGPLFMGYRLLPGVTLTREAVAAAPVSQRRRWAQQAGSFLWALHTLAVVGTVVVDLLPRDTADDWRALLTAFEQHLRPLMPPLVWAKVAAEFDAALGEPGLFDVAPALRHGDFGAGNLLVDPVSGDLCGVIDFGFAALGDPAVDIAAASTFGDDFLEAMRPAYPALDERLGRARFIRSTYALQEALHGVVHGDPEALEAGLSSYR